MMPNLTDYYTKAQTEALIPAQANLTNYYTKTQVDALIPPAVDLSEYYTKLQADTKFLDDQEVNAKIYAYDQQVATNTIIVNNFTNLQTQINTLLNSYAGQSTQI